MNRLARQCLVAAPVALLTLAASAPASAGGLYIWEFGHPAQGSSGAGAGALAQDASTSFLNPAGIMELENSEMMVSGIIIDSKVEFKQDQERSSRPPSVSDSNGSRPASNGGDAGSTAIGAGFWYARPVNEKWGWGVSLGSISGAALEYNHPEDFAGRYWATEVDLLTINVTPTVAFRVSDNFSLGFGIPVMFGQLEMDVAIPNPLLAGGEEGLAEINNGDDIQATGLVSALWKVNDRFNLGAMYLGKVELTFNSDLKLTLPPITTPDKIAADVDITYPQTVRTWGAFELNDRVSLLGTIAWEDWSTFDSIPVSTPRVGGALPRNWDDTWHFGAGLKIKTAGPWTWYTGIAYDTDPTTAEDRTADMPIDEQWRLSLGANRERSNGHRWGFSLTYADYGDADIDNGGSRPVSGLPWTVTGRYTSNSIIFLGANYGW